VVVSAKWHLALPCTVLLKHHESLPAWFDLQNEAMPKYTAAHMYAAIAVRSAVRGFMQRHLLKEKLGSQGGWVLRGGRTYLQDRYQ
jgi:hypothetical protein